MSKTVQILAAAALAAALFTGCNLLPEPPESGAASQTDFQPDSQAAQSSPETASPMDSDLPGPIREMQVVIGAAEQEAGLYAQPDRGSELLTPLPLTAELVRIEEKDGFSKCVVGDQIGWVPNENLSSKWMYEPEAVPDFLPEELQLLYLKAVALFNNYGEQIQPSSGYQGYTETDRIYHAEDGWHGCPDLVYPTEQQWREALGQVFTLECIQERFEREETDWDKYREIDGQLYFSGGDRGTMGVGQMRFSLLEKTPQRIRFDVLCEWEAEQAAQVKYPIELVKTSEGWRFSSFITSKDDITWSSLREKVLEQQGPKQYPEGETEELSFLNGEQQAVYARALDWEEALYGLTDNVVSLGFVQSGQPTGRVPIDGVDYQLYEDSYEEFSREFLKVFTADCLTQLEESGRYRSYEGRLAADQRVGSALQEGIYWDLLEHHPDTYRLESQSEEEICFTLISHYDKTPEGPLMDVGTREYPIRMVKTPEGWRLAEFHTSCHG